VAMTTPDHGRPPLRRHALRGLVAAALLLAAAAAAGDYRDAYKAGLDAIAQKQWAEGARQMRLAIAERPEAAGMLSSTFLRRYTPHYHLGVALSELGECHEAVEAFDTAERQGKLAKEEVPDLERRRQLCRQRIARVAEAVAAAQREIDAGAAAAIEVGRVEGSPAMAGIWNEGTPSFAARQQGAMGKLASARGALADADRELDADAAAAAGRLAVQARHDLETLGREAGQRRDELVARLELERSEMGKVATAAQRDLDFVTRSLAPLPPDLARRATELRTVLADVAAAGQNNQLAELQALHDRLRKATRDLRSAVRPPPDDLQQAARAYFAGDYATALSLLGQRQFTEPRAAAHACLLRAAALHGAHRVAAAPGDDPAAGELRHCLRMPVKAKMPAGLFPPTFQTVYDAVVAEAEQPPPTP
jgi:tetratricopeptide (TPR) repeat protein